MEFKMNLPGSISVLFYVEKKNKKNSTATNLQHLTLAVVLIVPWMAKEGSCPVNI